MTSEEFNTLTKAQLKRCEDVLCIKADEYATDDRLHNFKQAALLQEVTSATALKGMMCKHTISVYDMIKGLEEGKEYPLALWNEKITDSMNYLLLLWAIVNEDKETECGIQPTPIEN